MKQKKSSSSKPAIPKKPIAPKKQGDSKKQAGPKKQIVQRCVCTECEEEEKLEKVTSQVVLINTKEVNGDVAKTVPREVYNYGEHGCGFKSKGPPQDFYALREEHFKAKKLFEDHEFVTDLSFIRNLPKDKTKPLRLNVQPEDVQWLRPHEICKKPKMFCEGFSRFDINEGIMDNSNLLAAVALLTSADHQFIEIVPLDQSFEKNYAGIFHFRIWHYGRWIDTVVDDRLPCYHKSLIFAKSTDKSEFWGSLFEKAYAKLYGGYGLIQGVSTLNAMQDLTGGVAETYDYTDLTWKQRDTEEVLQEVTQLLLQAQERGSFVCANRADPETLEGVEKQRIEGYAEYRQEVGVPYKSHSVTKCLFIRIAETPTFAPHQRPTTGDNQPTYPDQWWFIIRVKNPLGSKFEWNGQFSDDDTLWEKVNPRNQMDNIQLESKEDGEFWIPLYNFLCIFDIISVCHMTPDSMSDIFVKKTKKKWNTAMHEGQWVREVTAGGPNINEMHINPQFILELEEPDDDGPTAPPITDSGESSANPNEGKKQKENFNTIVIEMSVKNHPRYLKREKMRAGFSIWKVPDLAKASRPLEAAFFKANPLVFKSDMTKERSCYRIALPAGDYVIVPYTEKANQEADFILRVFTPQTTHLTENDDAFGIDDTFNKADFENQFHPDPKETTKAYLEFAKIAGDKEVSWEQLRKCLNTVLASSGREFSKSLCQSMMALMDYDNSGKLSLEEFKNLWEHIRVWKEIFKVYDYKNIGSIDGHSLREAFKRAGYKMNSRILNLIMHRYGDEDGRVAFDDFIMCAVKLLELFEKFKTLSEGTNELTFTMEDWLAQTVYT